MFLIVGQNPVESVVTIECVKEACMYWVRVSVLLTGLNKFGHIVVKSVARETYDEPGEVKASNYAGGFKAVLQKEVHQSIHLIFSKEM